jgi:hypothetical protein
MQNNICDNHSPGNKPSFCNNDYEPYVSCNDNEMPTTFELKTDQYGDDVTWEFFLLN